jgi:hypothetical protein
MVYKWFRGMIIKSYIIILSYFSNKYFSLESILNRMERCLFLICDFIIIIIIFSNHSHKWRKQWIIF